MRAAHVGPDARATRARLNGDKQFGATVPRFMPRDPDRSRLAMHGAPFMLARMPPWSTIVAGFAPSLFWLWLVHRRDGWVIQEFRESKDGAPDGRG